MGLPFSANSRVSETSLVLSPVPFDNPYIFPFNSQNLLVSAFFYMLSSIRRERSFAPPQKWLFSMVTWGIKCART